MKDIVEIYKETKDFKKAVELSGLSALAAHVRLLSSGVLSIEDKILYGSYNQMRGAKAEELFKKLVPKAIDANQFVKKNNPIYDFMVGDLTIDIKYASLTTSRCEGEWSVKFSKNVKQKHADLYVIFLERKKEAFLDDPIILVVAGAFVRFNSKTYTINSPLLKEFSIKDTELAQVIDDFSKIKNKVD